MKMKFKKLRASLAAALCCVMMAAPVTVLAKAAENADMNPMRPELIHTQEWQAGTVAAIHAVYDSDIVRIMPGSSDKIILKEYLTEDRERYYATADIRDSTLHIKMGERPNHSYHSRIELLIPASFTGTSRIDVTTGIIKVGDVTSGKVIVNTTNGLIEVSGYSGIVDCKTETGIITLEECTLEGSLYSESGHIDMDLNGLTGDLTVISDTGLLRADISGTIDFKIEAETETGWVTNHFSDDFSVTEKTISGSWGKNPQNTITLKTNNGFVNVKKK